MEGGIKENLSLERFNASSVDVIAKDQIDLMSRCWFSLSANRTDPIEHEFEDSRTNRKETIRITGSPEYGIATIHDQDLVIFAISQWVEASNAGLNPSRRICFTPYQFFKWTGKAPQGTAYERLWQSLHRLKTTNIETTIRNGGKRDRTKVFSWISQWETREEGGKISGVEVVLAEWLFESIQNFHVLTLDKGYFDIPGPVERWLYLYARKATGGPNGMWKETFKSLYKKSASQQPYKHYASRLRKLVGENNLPGIRLERQTSGKGKDMLLMVRTDKRETVAAKAEAQLPLIELTPLEEAWENVLELLRIQYGQPTVKSWIEPLRLGEISDGVLTFRAPTKFIAEWAENNFAPKLVSAWQSVGYEIVAVRFEAKKEKSAA